VTRAIEAAHLPAEPAEGATVAMTVDFGDGTPYTYVLYRAVTGAWYVTGQSGPKSWRALWTGLAGARLVEAVELGRGRVLAW
jgi:hypothetical protein